MMRNFAAHSRNDGGVLVLRFMKAIFEMIENYQMNEKNRVFILRHFLKLFEVTELIPAESVSLAELYKEQVSLSTFQISLIYIYSILQVQKLSSAWIHDSYTRALFFIKDAELTSYKSIQLFVWIATLPSNNLKAKTVLQKLLMECKDDTIAAVVNVIE